MIDKTLQEHKGLVYHMLTQTNQLYNPDAESAAWEALWRASETYDKERGVPFSSYACKVIKNAIYDTIRVAALESNKLHMYVDIETYAFGIFDIYPTCSLARQIDELFKDYIKTRTGLVKDILLAWYSTGFNTTTTNLATMCSTSTSYVSRVQTAFRAYLSRELGE